MARLSCFCPIMEVGPTDDRAPWDMAREPSYDVELIAIWRTYAKLHTRLMDYSYQCAKEAWKTGVPIVRPLFLAYPKLQQSWEDWQTYCYGPDILVSAIWEKGTTKHKLYLPAPDEWVDAWDTSKVYQGGQIITVDAPLYKMPIFIKKGAKVLKSFADLQKLYDESLAIAKNKPDIKALENKTVW